MLAQCSEHWLSDATAASGDAGSKAAEASAVEALEATLGRLQTARARRRRSAELSTQSRQRAYSQSDHGQRGLQPQGRRTKVMQAELISRRRHSWAWLLDWPPVNARYLRASSRRPSFWIPCTLTPARSASCCWVKRALPDQLSAAMTVRGSPNFGCLLTLCRDAAVLSQYGLATRARTTGCWISDCDPGEPSGCSPRAAHSAG
jgi:hypothetical protein